MTSYSKKTELHIKTILEKTKFVHDYINDKTIQNNIHNTSTTNCKFTLNDHLLALHYFEFLGLSCEQWDVVHYLMNSNFNFPKSKTLNDFSRKLNAKHVNEQIYKDHINNNPQLNTKIKSMDTTFVQNECCSTKNKFIDRNPFFKNKYGSKINILSNETGTVLDFEFYSANTHDSKIGLDFIQHTNKNLIENSIILADSGYDSKEFKQKITDLKGSSIIPQNKRNKDSNEVKTQKEKIKNNADVEIKNNKQQIKETQCDKNISKQQKQQIINEHKQNNLKIKETMKLLLKNTKNYINKKNKNKNGKKIKKPFNLGLTVEENVIYKKRSAIERTNRKIKIKNTSKIYTHSIATFKQAIYGRLMDLLIFEKVKRQ